MLGFFCIFVIMARPTEYNYELAQEICEKLTTGEFKNVGQVIDSDKKKYPSRATFYNWKREHKELLDLYVNIQQDRGDLLLEEMDEITQELRRGDIDPSTANVLIQTLKWKAAKFYPKMYGDKQQTDITTNGESLNKRPIIIFNDNEDSSE